MIIHKLHSSFSRKWANWLVYASLVTRVQFVATCKYLTLYTL